MCVCTVPHSILTRPWILLSRNIHGMWALKQKYKQKLKHSSSKDKKYNSGRKLQSQYTMDDMNAEKQVVIWWLTLGESPQTKQHYSTVVGKFLHYLFLNIRFISSRSSQVLHRSKHTSINWKNTFSQVTVNILPHAGKQSSLTLLFGFCFVSRRQRMRALFFLQEAKCHGFTTPFIHNLWAKTDQALKNIHFKLRRTKGFPFNWQKKITITR